LQKILSIQKKGILLRPKIGYELRHIRNKETSEKEEASV
jgi:hypothetical protein